MKMFLATVFNTEKYGAYKDTWKMYVAKYNGTIYISNKEDNILTVAIDSKRKEPKLSCRDQNEERKKIIYMGLKLEEVLSVTRESQDRPSDRKVEGRQGFYSVKKGKFCGHHLVLIRSQIDFVENVSVLITTFNFF